MLAATTLNIFINLLLVLQVIICLVLGLLVLMQRPKNEGLGAAFGSGMTDSILGAGTTSVLQKGTVYFGILFFAVTLGLSILIGHRNADPNLAASVSLTPDIPNAEIIVDPEESASTGDLAKELEELEKAKEEASAEEAPAAEVEEPSTEPEEAPAEALEIPEGTELSVPTPAAPPATEQPANQ